MRALNQCAAIASNKNNQTCTQLIGIIILVMRRYVIGRGQPCEDSKKCSFAVKENILPWVRRDHIITNKRQEMTISIYWCQMASKNAKWLFWRKHTSRMPSIMVSPSKLMMYPLMRTGIGGRNSIETWGGLMLPLFLLLGHAI